MPKQKPPERDRSPSRVATRVISLDGLRGLAASSVLLAHAIGALSRTPAETLALFKSPISILANGGGGVNLFFVLSGYCLFGSASRAMSMLGLSQYYVRRVLRIHVPFVAALFLSWLASVALYPSGEPPAGMSGWTIAIRNVEVTLPELGRSLLFPGSAFDLVPVGWTLRVEMIYSLLLPFMIWLVLRSHWGLLVVLSLVVLFLDWKTLPVKHYAIDFSVGIAIYCERERLAELFSRLAGWRASALMLVGVVILALPNMLLIMGRYQRVSILLYCLGSLLLVAGAIHDPPFRNLLTRPSIAWIGRVSYSIYLTHIPIIVLLAGFVQEPQGIVGTAAFALSCLLASFLVSALFFRIAEKPSIDLGYAASAKLGAVFWRGLPSWPPTRPDESEDSSNE